MKNFTFILIFLIPLMAFAQEPLSQFRKKAMTETTFGKNQIIQPLKKIEELQKEFSVNSISKKISQLQAEEEGLKNSFRGNYPGREIIEKLRENRLNSAQADSMLIDSLYIFTFRSPTDSVLTGRVYATYNPKGNFAHIWRSERDTLTMQWRNSSKDDYYYDGNDRNTSYINFEWDVVKNEWLPVSKHEMEYDSNGRRTISADYDWNNDLKKWIGRYKDENAWDELGRRILSAWYFWDDTIGSWIGNHKYETSYDETGKPILYINYQWNSSTNNWQGSGKQETAYDDMGNITLNIHSAWMEIYGGWIFLSKNESVFGQDGSMQTADYIWDQNNKKWIGQNKTERYILNQTEHYYITYSWNIIEDSWEESAKSLSKWFNDGLSHQLTTYSQQDSIIPGLVINGFNTEEDINTVWIDLSCPEQTCSVLDSDFVEGGASIRWNYHASGKINSWGGVCQFEMLNSKDLKGFDGISMNYKVLESSFANFVFILIESDGEIWEYTNHELPRDTLGLWKVLTVSFLNMSLRNYVDGIFNAANIEKILIQAFSESGKENTGTILLDNLSACNIAKSEVWMPMSIEEEIFGENGNLISSIQSRWDPFLQDFIPIYKYKIEMVYDENGNIISQNSYEWNEFMDSEDWKNIRKQQFEYDEFGNQTRSEFYMWDENINKWTGNFKTDRSFDGKGNILTSVSYTWDYVQDRWNPEYKEEYTFAADSIQISNASYYWDLNINKWIGNYKYETVFNDALEDIKRINYEWDLNADAWKVVDFYWVGHYKDQYDSEGKLQAFVYETWSETFNKWVPIEKYYYFWSLHSISTGIPEDLSHHRFLEVYPNPATDVIQIKLNSGNFHGSFSLFNSNGLLLKKSNLTGNITSVWVKDLPKGNYILRVKTDEHVKSQKIIIQ